jgi:transposase
MHVASVGIDLGKNTFHLVALDAHGKIVAKLKFSRRQLLAYTANLPSSLIGIEACSGAHFIGAALRAQGHDVRLIPAQLVKPFLKSNKNDFLDAEAIAEAVGREEPTMSSNNVYAGQKTCDVVALWASIKPRQFKMVREER